MCGVMCVCVGGGGLTEGVLPACVWDEGICHVRIWRADTRSKPCGGHVPTVSGDPDVLPAIDFLALLETQTPP